MKKSCTINSVLLHDDGCKPLAIEIEKSQGIGIHVVGMPDNECKAMLLRVVKVLSSKGVNLPGQKIIIYIPDYAVGLRHARWSLLDLPIFLGLANLCGIATIDKNAIYLGNLSEDGHLSSGYGMCAELSNYAKEARRYIVAPIGFQATVALIGNVEILLD